MSSETRQQQLKKIFPNEPSYRLAQIRKALFDPDVKSWQDVTTLPKKMRTILSEGLPFSSVESILNQKNSNKDTFKTLLRLAGNETIETVLMKNRTGAWTICVSSQVGCAMNCVFCATGKLGLRRQLTSDEIVDQYRYWRSFLSQNNLPGRISNIVYMGMGEPLANYENVKDSLNEILSQTDVGSTHITVSTVGILPRLEQLLTDPKWPHVRMAISLHSADLAKRKKLMPSTADDFLNQLRDWAKKYLEKFGNRRHHLTFEYILLRGVNDSPDDLAKLAKYVRSIGNVRVNLIPYNSTNSGFSASPKEEARLIQNVLEKRGITVTIRRSMGEDIAAACGQLAKQSRP